MLGQARQSGVFAVGAIAQEDVTRFEFVPELSEQAQVMVTKTAQQDVEDGPAGQGHEGHEFHDGKATATFLTGGLGITLLVLRGVGQLGGGTIDDEDSTALELAALAGAGVGALGGGGESLLQTLQGQALAGLDIGRVAFIDRRACAQAAQSLDLAHHFTAGSAGLEHLPDKAFEGQGQGEDPVAAVGSLVPGGEEGEGQAVAQVLLELSQGGLAQGVGGASAEGGQAVAEGREVRSVHSKYIYLYN